MEIIEIAQKEIETTPKGVKARRLVSRPAVAVVNLILEPGGEVKTHTTAVDVYFHVLEGEGTVEVGEEKEKVKAGQIIISPANIPHALYASENTIFSVLVVKTPNPNQ